MYKLNVSKYVNQNIVEPTGNVMHSTRNLNRVVGML